MLCAGSYHGLNPTYRQSADYGVMHVTADKVGKVTDVTIWRAGFQEEREVLVRQLARTYMKNSVFSSTQSSHAFCRGALVVVPQHTCRLLMVLVYLAA
jgi:hypothetical protein